MSVLLIHKPDELDYDGFFQQVMPHISGDVDVCITKAVGDTQALNTALLLVYSQLRHIAHELGFPHTFSIDVLANCRTDLNAYTRIFSVKDEPLDIVPPSLRLKVQTVDVTPQLHHLEATCISMPFESVPTVAVGGTFDHMHDGHKILLLLAAFCASATVIVGVTGPKLLENKKYLQYMQLFGTRCSSVCRFLERRMEHKKFVVYQINDVCGPTGYISDIDALVISDETADGAKFVNAQRAKIGFAELRVVAASVLGGSADDKWLGKVSSTDMRRAEAELQARGR